MTIEWYCTEGCKAAADCKHRHERGDCVYEYDASKSEPEFRWRGDGPPPKRWKVGNTMVYRCYADYCD